MCFNSPGPGISHIYQFTVSNISMFFTLFCQALIICDFVINMFFPILLAGSGNGLAISNILEVCDLPNLQQRSDYENLLRELVAAGADIQFSTSDTLLHLGDVSCNNQTISSPSTRVYAVFVDSHYASQMLNTHSSSNYKLRLVDNIADSHA